MVIYLVAWLAFPDRPATLAYENQLREICELFQLRMVF